MEAESSIPSLTDQQRSVIVGSLLGDGAMRCKKNALLEINHCAAQRVYVDWKYDMLQNIVGTPPKLRAGNGARSAYRFTTLSVPELTPYYKTFYQSGRKAVPDIQLTPLALAVWFMDDGSRSHRAVYFNTQQFDVLSQQRLLQLLSYNFGIEGTLNRDKQYYRIRISVESIPSLRVAIAPHLLSDFRYKLPGNT